jgi:survival-of-motor-neuron-related-splicing factor 30
LKVGDECQARYSGDSKFYPARIISLGGSLDNRVYSVIFNGYDTSTELVTAINLKPLTDSKKRALEISIEDIEKEKKKKKNEKKLESRQAKSKEQQGKQSAWQSFAKKVRSILYFITPQAVQARRQA